LDTLHTGDDRRAGLWRLWLSRPKCPWLRKAVFQIHLWPGLILGLYGLCLQHWLMCSSDY
jgi:hypothetical protein